MKSYLIVVQHYDIIVVISHGYDIIVVMSHGYEIIYDIIVLYYDIVGCHIIGL